MDDQAQQGLLQWIDEHFDEQVAFLQQVIRIPTDTPPGNNAPHADAVADMLSQYGWTAEKHGGRRVAATTAPGTRPDTEEHARWEIGST